MKQQKIRLGAYYTDSKIAEFINQKVIFYWLSDIWKNTISFSEFQDFLEGESNNISKFVPYFENMAQVLPSLKILDPAVGSGNFLVTMANILERIYVKIRPNETGILDPSLENRSLRKYLIQQHLYGWDINKQAIQTTQQELSKWINNIEPTQYINSNDLLDKREISPELFIEDLASNFIIQDSLNPNIRTLSSDFSIIIGNPPFGNLIKNENRKKLIPFYKTRISEIAELFLEQSILLLKNFDNAILGFVMPKTLCYYQSWSKCRNLILENTVKEIVDLGLSFKNVNFETIALLIKKNKELESKSLKNIKQYKQNYAISKLFPQTNLNEYQFFDMGILPSQLLFRRKFLIFAPLSEMDLEIIHEIQANCIFLPEISEELENSNLHNFIFRSHYFSNKQKGKFTNGTQYYIDKVPDLERYLIKRVYRIKVPESIKISKFLQPKIMFKVFRGSRLSVFADMKGEFLTTEKIINFIPKKKYTPYLHGLQILLNARPVSFYLQALVYNQTTETSRVMDPFYAAEIPIPICSEEQLQFLEIWGKIMILIHYQNNKEIIQLFEKFTEFFISYMYLPKLFSHFKSKKDPTPEIKHIQNQENIMLIMEMLEPNKFEDHFEKILKKISWQLPISSKRITAKNVAQEIFSEEILSKINEQIKTALNYYQIELFQKSEIFKAIYNLLGK